MNTFLSRANTIFAFTLSVMAALTFGCFLTTAFSQNISTVMLKTGKILVKNMPDYSARRERSDLGLVVFDLRSDLTKLFNWNVKMLFVYLTAEYETAEHKINQVVLWDKIIRREDNAILDYHSLNTKYYFWDSSSGLRGNKNVTLVLSWNVIPNAGALPNLVGEGTHQFSFPKDYSSGNF